MELWARLSRKDDNGELIEVYSINTRDYTGQSLSRRAIARRNRWALTPERVIDFEVREQGRVIDSGCV